MALLPNIYAIQATDAPCHTDKLRKILQRLKAKNWIKGFFTFEVDTLVSDAPLSSITNNVKDGDMILIVLTHQLESQREQIENQCIGFMALPKIKVAEIIVDNVGYTDLFKMLPADLRPIRDWNDMDAAWSDIEQSLKDLLPAKKFDGDVSQYKSFAIIGYIFPVLFFISLVNDSKNNSFAKYQANQQLLLLLWYMFGVGLYILSAWEPFMLALSSIFGIIGLVCMFYGILNVINEEMRPLPLIGRYTLIK